MKQKAIICDLDGTLTNIDHRLHYILQDEKDWNNFYKSCEDDKLNLWCGTILRAIIALNSGLIHAGVDNIVIIFITGRSDICSKETKRWLMKCCNFSHYDYELYMRKDEDHRNDFEIKKEIYESSIKDNYDILFVIEDRASVVDMWRNLGLTCLQCAKGDF